jgi:hypothetical protein
MPPDAFVYPEARHGRCELRHVNGVPVLRLAGAPEESGAAQAILGVGPARPLLDYPEDLLHYFVKSRPLARLLLRRVIAIGGAMLRRFAAPHRREFEALVAGVDRGLALAANVLPDMKNLSPWRVFGCSSLVVPAGASATGEPLFGRNLDFFTLGYLQRYSLVTVRPASAASRAFATVGLPGVLGAYSGMNEAGLALASHEVYHPPGPRLFDPRGVPFALAYRQVLEQCASAAEAAELLRRLPRTTSTLLMLCDRQGASVLEVTPDRVITLSNEGGFAACTNHFLSPALARRRARGVYRSGERLATLRAAVSSAPLDVAGVHAALAAVAQGELTMQTMVFEPAALRLHVALGACPSTALPLRTLELGPLFAG